MSLAGPVRWSLLFLRMLRYRVALMLWLFLLLGAAHRGSVAHAGGRLAWAAAALAAGYVAATTANDVADREIDVVNHPRDPARPLVSGDATSRDFIALHAVAATLAVALGAILGPAGAMLAGASVAIGHAYSLPPVRLSHRTYLAPVVLAFGYVLVPYGLGLVAVGADPTGSDAAFLGALMLLFVARIVLKDFRDRRGDAMYGRPTLLLRFGTRVTCAVSFVALVAGNLVLLLGLRPPIGIALGVETLFVAIASRLWALSRATDPREQQLAIGLGARMGNAALISVLAWQMLDAEGAPAAHAVIVVGVIVIIAWSGFLAVDRDPRQAVIAYKG